MSGKSPYTYVILRYSHDPAAGEAINVGVVLHSRQENFLRAKMRHTVGRISRIYPDIDAEGFKSTMRMIERAINGRSSRALAGNGSSQQIILDFGNRDARGFAVDVIRDDDSSFVWGDVGSGLTTNPADTLAKLYSRFVGRYEEGGRAHRDDDAVWRPVRDRLAARNLVNKLEPVTIQSAVDQIRFEHAWKNGAWHCYQPISFDLANADTIRDKARRWVGQLATLRDASVKFQTYFIVGGPADIGLNDDFQAAVAMLHASPGDPVVYDEHQIDELVDRLEDGLRASETY